MGSKSVPFDGQYVHVQQVRNRSVDELASGWRRGEIDATWHCTECHRRRSETIQLTRFRLGICKDMQEVPMEHRIALFDGEYIQMLHGQSNPDVWQQMSSDINVDKPLFRIIHELPQSVKSELLLWIKDYCRRHKRLWQEPSVLPDSKKQCVLMNH